MIDNHATSVKIALPDKMDYMNLLARVLEDSNAEMVLGRLLVRVDRYCWKLAIMVEMVILFQPGECEEIAKIDQLRHGS
jgi:hypothetical protein